MAAPRKTKASNRALRRAAAKADVCLKRATKVPAGVRAKLQRLNPALLAARAQLRGVKILPTGQVIRVGPAVDLG